jgi:hypothetical protein
MTLTDEQKTRIEENKRRALEIQAKRADKRSLTPQTDAPLLPKRQSLNAAQPSTSTNATTRPPLAQIQSNGSTNIQMKPRQSKPSTSNSEFNPLAGYKPKITIELEVYSTTEIQVSFIFKCSVNIILFVILDQVSTVQ